MLDQKVLISDENNYYDGMVGKVIEEHKATAFVEIKFSNTKQHQVMFYKDQLEIISNNLN